MPLISHNPNMISLTFFIMHRFQSVITERSDRVLYTELAISPPHHLNFHKRRLLVSLIFMFFPSWSDRPKINKNKACTWRDGAFRTEEVSEIGWLRCWLSDYIWEDNSFNSRVLILLSFAKCSTKFWYFPLCYGKSLLTFE